MIEAIVDAVGNRAIGEDGRKATSAGFEQILRPAHVEIAFMLARKARGRQILRRCRTSHRNGDAGPCFSFQLPIRFQDLCAHRLGVRRLIDDGSSLGGLGRKLPDLALVEAVEKPMKLIRDSRLQ